MTGNEYQRLAMITKNRGSVATLAAPIAISALGLTGEAGEVADEIKKVVAHGKELNVAALQKEIGDTLWYVASLCDDLGLNLDDVMAANIEKLRQRYPDGFKSHSQTVITRMWESHDVDVPHN